jgi:hypothetical protein
MRHNMSFYVTQKYPVLLSWVPPQRHAVVCASFYSTNTSLCICRIQLLYMQNTVTVYAEYSYWQTKSRSRSHVTVHKTIRLRENYKTGIPCLWYSLKLRHYTSENGDRGGTVVKVLCYKSKGHWFDSRWCHSAILPIALWPWGRLSLWQKWVLGAFPGGKGGRCVRLTSLPYPVPLSWNLGTLTSWNPLGHSRPVTGLIYFYMSENMFN